jgi:hypothetical protein
MEVRFMRLTSRLDRGGCGPRGVAPASLGASGPISSATPDTNTYHNDIDALDAGVTGLRRR